MEFNQKYDRVDDEDSSIDFNDEINSQLNEIT